MNDHEESSSIYYQSAWRALTAQTSCILRDFRSIQRQATLESREKTAQSLSDLCYKALSTQLLKTSGYKTSDELSSGFYWYINPLDGVNNFIRGNAMFATSVTLMNGENPLISMVNLPVFGKIIWVEPSSGIKSNLGLHSVNRNLDLSRSYVVKNDFGCNTIGYVYTAYGNFDAFILSLSEIEGIISSFFITEGGGKISRIGSQVLGSNKLLHQELRSKVLDTTMTSVRRGTSFCCGPTQKVPDWSGQIYEKALVSRSHRSHEGIVRIRQVQSMLRQLLQIPEEYKILLLNGSATGALECGFFNFLGHRPIQNISYDVFGRRWGVEIGKMLQSEVKIDRNKVFLNNLEYKLEGEDADSYEIETSVHSDLVLVYTGTSTGRRWQAFSWLKKRLSLPGLTICDATSALFAENIQWKLFDVVCGSFQKALGAEAGLGLVILGPKAINQLTKLGRIFTPPRIIRLDEQVIQEVSDGKLINTISMMNLEEIAHNLGWAIQNGGLSFLQKRCMHNQRFIISNLPPDLELILQNDSERALTVLCIRPKDLSMQNWDFIRLVSTRAAEKGVHETSGHPEEIPCWRFWTGPTCIPDGFKIFVEAYKEVLNEIPS